MRFLIVLFSLVLAVFSSPYVIDVLDRGLEDHLIKQFKSGPVYKIYRDKGVTLVYKEGPNSHYGPGLEKL